MGIIGHQIDIQFTYHLIVIDFLFIKYHMDHTQHQRTAVFKEELSRNT